MSQEFTISSGPLPGSEKIYVKGEMFDIEVPMRRINLTPTVDTDGTKIENEPVVVYDTSGPYTDPNYTVDLHKGLPKIREQWIADRNDTVKLEGLSSEYGRARQNDRSLDALRFEHVNTTPRVAKPGHRVSQMYYGNGIHRHPREPDGRQDPGGLQERERRAAGRELPGVYNPGIRASGSGRRTGHHPREYQPPGERADDHRT